jgi:SAM-dependent methyltransferase
MKTSNDSGWKEASTKAFQQQFALNLRELNDPPNHWRFFLEELNRMKSKDSRVVDIGCGVGSLSKLIRMWHGEVEYMGYDYSNSAITTAKDMWGNIGNFEEKDYEDLSFSDIKDNDILVANALCDVLPDGDRCMNHLLSLGAKHIIFLRVRITEKESYFEEYEAYGEIKTYAFYHNRRKVNDAIHHNGYGAMRNCQYTDGIVNITAEKDATTEYAQSRR